MDPRIAFVGPFVGLWLWNWCEGSVSAARRVVCPSHKVAEDSTCLAYAPEHDGRAGPIRVMNLRDLTIGTFVLGSGSSAEYVQSDCFG